MHLGPTCLQAYVSTLCVGKRWCAGIEFAQGPNVAAMSQVTFSRANLLAGQFRWSRLAGSTGKHMFRSACWQRKVCWLAFCSNSGAMSSCSALICLQDNADGANLPKALQTYVPACLLGGSGAPALSISGIRILVSTLVPPVKH